MATRRELIENATKLLRDASVPLERREIEWLLQEAEPCDRLDIVTRSDRVVPEDAEARFDSFVARRRAREPVQYVLGHAEFMGLTFKVDRSVLIPRPETELLVEGVLDHVKRHPEATVIDVGTGSGCVAISVKRAAPGTRVAGVDVSRAALDTAAGNGRFLGADVEWVLADMYDTSFAADVIESTGIDRFDVVVSNPPYVPPSEYVTLQPEITRFEPEIALLTGADSFAPYTALAGHGRRLLASGGRMMVEIHEEGAADVSRTFSEAGYDNVTVLRDLSGKERFVTATCPDA